MTTLSMQDKINGFLQFLSTNKNIYWTSGIQLLFQDDPDAGVMCIQNVETKLHRMGAPGACGIVVGSTVQLLEKYDPNLLPTECTVILSSLRDQNRIIQIGKGRGKAVLLVTADPIVYAGPDDIDPSDRKAVLKALQDAVADDAATIEKLTLELNKKTSQLQALEREVRELRRQQSVSDRLTWG